jgi:hypothetical protein
LQGWGIKPYLKSVSFWVWSHQLCKSFDLFFLYIFHFTIFVKYLIYYINHNTCYFVLENDVMCYMYFFQQCTFFRVKKNDYLIRNMMNNYVLYNNKNWCVIANVIIIVNLYILTDVICSKKYLLLWFKIIALYDDLSFFCYFSLSIRFS